MDIQTGTNVHYIYPKRHDYSDLEYWVGRWSRCFPYTYPPELFSKKWVTRVYGWWIFKREYGYYVSVCDRCGERICTGHMCKDLKEYNLRGN